VSDEKDEKKPTTKKEQYAHLAASKSQEKTNSKGAKRTLITDEDAQTEEETNTHADTDVNQDEQQEAPKDNVVQLFNDPAMELIHVVESGKKKKKMEDIRKRSTYWLLPEERTMVNKMAKETGYVKYDVVGLAIRSMYDRMMKAKEEKKTKKKPDQQ
jgi:hypothetical protein